MKIKKMQKIEFYHNYHFLLNDSNLINKSNMFDFEAFYNYSKK